MAGLACMAIGAGWADRLPVDCLYRRPGSCCHRHGRVVKTCVVRVPGLWPNWGRALSPMCLDFGPYARSLSRACREAREERARV